jgi:hypothetical protein
MSRNNNSRNSSKGKKSNRSSSFDPEAPTIIFIPPLVGQQVVGVSLEPPPPIYLPPASDFFTSQELVQSVEARSRNNSITLSPVPMIKMHY